MTDTVGVHISETQITAVRFDSSSTEPPRVIVLGDSDAAAAAVVAKGQGDSVLVGDEAALVTDGPRVTNPLQRAATGRIGALAAVLSFVIRRATAVDGRTPARLAVVIDDDWQRAARDRIVQAGVASGIADTVVVPHAAASARPTPVSGVAALAAGAARVGSLSSAQFVTREDLGQPITSKTPVAPVPDVPRPESVSVFEDESLVEVARPGPEQLSSSEPGEFGATRVMGPVGGSAAPAGSYMPRRTGLSQATITLALVLLVGVVGGLLIFFAGDDSDNVRTIPDTVPEETTPVDTEPPTTAVTTTEEIVTLTTSEPPTTEAPEVTQPTTSTTTTSTTTTTTPVGVGSPGPVTLVETGLQFDTGRVVQFGQPMSEVIEAVRSILGAPDSATNFQSSEACVENTRAVRWGQLELVFLQDPPVAVPVGPDSQLPGDGTEFIPVSTGTFGQWYVTGYTSPTGLVTRDGLGVSATVGFLEVTYGASFVLVQPAEEEGSDEVVPEEEGSDEEEPTEEERGVFSISNPASGGVINGITSDVTPEGRVLNMWAGDACQRNFI